MNEPERLELEQLKLRQARLAHELTQLSVHLTRLEQRLNAPAPEPVPQKAPEPQRPVPAPQPVKALAAAPLIAIPPVIRPEPVVAQTAAPKAPSAPVAAPASAAKPEVRPAEPARPKEPVRLRLHVDAKDEDYLKGLCQHCSGHLEFPAKAAGETISCPHCSRSTVLSVAAKPASAPPVAKPIPVAPVGPPRAPTLLDVAKGHGREVIGIGKISDIFAGQGITKSIKTEGNDDTFARMLECVGDAPDGSITFANFVDFDQSYGHRRDVPGYAKALEDFDARIPSLLAALKPGDLVVFSADHGCDPTMPGSDHTREYVPVIAFGPHIAPGPVGKRDSFADIGQSIAAHLKLPALAHGRSFL